MSGVKSVTFGSVRIVAYATGEIPCFTPGDPIRILTRSPVGHYRVPLYLRGKLGYIESVIELPDVDNEEEGYGRNAGIKRHYYRVAVTMSEIWRDYGGGLHDSLRIEIFETWLSSV